MAWLIEFNDEADRDFSKLDKTVQRRVFRYLHERSPKMPATTVSLSGIGLPAYGGIAWATIGSLPNRE